ncbi:hypothetical protein [Paracoccus aminophilus]|uniref:Excalibur calcium-binding domain-containing protein n=1 Tax=Paracoccus aminophilus JCM 7686 TaxID=1367847 RepID=S5YWQ0_PARAH|nr:hypothetical protein [Paracoccus aminophilus]AGT09626.1 hypothetical protein JCM7686_2558 [Paracoccus aminophilus JCM 7686]
MTMRKLAILGVMGLAVLGLSACNENAGWNPNYTMNASPYGEYQRARETALMTNTREPQVIPIQLPAQAPTPEDIAGKREVKAMVTTKVVPVQPAQVRVAPATRARVIASGDNAVLVRFAQTEKQNPGQARYARTGANPAQALKACSQFPNPAIAQTAFLANGGPILDPQNLDPDGDGFVCGWDPRPYRQGL